MSLIKEKRANISTLSAKLDMQSPLSVLSRGYAKISKNEDVVTSIKQLNNNDEITVTFADGTVNAIVTGEHNEKNDV
jgi:exodeoxyribonuclease VII large subunit